MKREETDFPRADGMTGSYWHGVLQDFSDFPELSMLLRTFVRLLVCVVLGGLIGLERERRGQDAGMRTHILVALGAAMFVLTSEAAGATPAHLTRVVQGVAVGISFVGAGTIIKVSQTKHVHGLTTAAGVWLTASIGVSAGLGRLALAVMCTFLALLVLEILRWLEIAFKAGEQQPPTPRTRKRSR